MKNGVWKHALGIALAISLLSGCSGQTDTMSSKAADNMALARELPAASESNEDSATSSDDDIIRPANWSEDTHSNSAAPDYDVVFPQDEVNRIDITINPNVWQTALDDMTANYGEFGSRSLVMPGDRRPQNGGGPLSGGEAGGAQPPDGEQQLPGRGAQPPGGDGGRRPENGGMGMPGWNTGDDNPIWIPISIDFEGDTWTGVGFRFKGNSSLRSSWDNGALKLPFRLDFDQFEDDYPETEDQRFYGFQKLTFSSNFSDASYLREKITADLFRKAGVPAAHTAFYEVYMDYGEGPVYLGLYTMTEVIEDTVIAEQFADDDGNVYKPDGNGASFAKGSFNEASFDKQTNEDEEDWSDVAALYEALHAESRTTDPAAWRAGLEAVFDVEGFLAYLAVNQVVQNWDTYGNIGHNYYLYNDPATGLLTWIPWDHNMALNANVGVREPLSISLDEVTEQWPLIRYLLDDAVYHAHYVADVKTFIATVFDPDALEDRYGELAALIEAAVRAEGEGDAQSRAVFYKAIEALAQHTYERYEAASKYVARQH